MESGSQEDDTDSVPSFPFLQTAADQRVRAAQSVDAARYSIGSAIEQTSSSSESGFIGVVRALLVFKMVITT